MSASTPFVRAGPDDAARVRDFVRAAYARWVPVLGREPSPMTVDYDAAVREHEIELLHEGDDLVAVVETYLAPGHLYVENIAVAPDRQGQGIGRRLLDHAEAKARAAGLSELRLLTNALMHANIRLYEAFGYAIDSRTPSPLGGETVHMIKRLDAAA